jgi:hypothetical protein
VSTVATPARPPRPEDDRRRLLGLDAVELACLIALGALSMLVLAALLSKGRPLSGADGLLAADQLQYLTWIREAAHHVVVGNRYDLAPGDRVFLHPGFAISGALHALGLSVPLSYLLWKPVAVAVLFAGALHYVRRLLPAPGPRHAALVLALFAVMPAAWIVAWTNWGGNPRQYTFDFISGEMWSTQYLWGYLMTAIAVGLMPLVLLWHERGRLWLGGGVALLVCWLQPWQGATLALIVLTVEVWRWWGGGGRPRLGALAVPAATAIPAAYYFVISRVDEAWKLAGDANAAGAMPEWTWPWWAIVLTVAPLAVPAALTWRMPAESWQEQAVRVWPFAVLAVYLLPIGTFPYHSLQGLAIPLAVLAVQGLGRVWRRPRAWVVVALLAFMTLPGLAHKFSVAIHSIRSAGDPFWVFDDEVRALQYIEKDRRRGGVFSSVYAGHMLPSRTGRETWAGALSWTPDWQGRQRLADGVVEGRITGERARTIVRDSRARFVFVDCRPRLADLADDLAPLLEEVKRFGCASVYVLRERPEMSLAAGLPDA